MCLINTHILIYWDARCICKLWKALWFYCVFFGYFHTLLTSIFIINNYYLHLYFDLRRNQILFTYFAVVAKKPKKLNPIKTGMFHVYLPSYLFWFFTFSMHNIQQHISKQRISMITIISSDEPYFLAHFSPAITKLILKKPK